MAGSPHRSTALIQMTWPLLSALGLLLLGSSLVNSLLSIRGETEGFGATITGLVLAFYYVGFIAGSLLTPAAVARVGHVRVFSTLTAIVAVATVAHATLVNPATWAVLRTLTGACLAGLYVVAESWLNTIATNDTRSHLLSLYMVVVMGAMGGGQLLLTAADPSGSSLFILAAVLVSLAIVPISVSASPAPTFSIPTRMRIRDLWAVAPVGVISGLGTGLANGAVLTMAPFYAISVGLSVTQTSVLMAIMIAGAVLLQIPIGRWSNHVRRRRSIIVVNFAAAIAAVAVIQLANGSIGQYVAIFLLGGFTFPIYALGVSHVNDLIEPDQIVSASALMVLLYGIGSVLGPTAASTAMTLAGPSALFSFMGGVHLIVVVLAIYRVVVRRSLPITAQRAFLPIPARASSIIGLLTRRER